MNGLVRQSNGKSHGASPGSPIFRGRSKSNGFMLSGKSEKLVERLMYFFISAAFRRKSILLVAPAVYITCMLMYMGTFNLEVVKEGVGGRILRRSPPGSVYRSPKVFEHLWPFMQAEGGNSSLAVILEIEGCFCFCFLFFLIKKICLSKMCR